MLYLMRHGSTEWNERKKLQGRTDIPLNDNGRAMAQRAHTEYGDVHFDVCFCSPLARARETAEIFLDGRGIPMITDDRLMEMSFGEFEGVEDYRNRSDCPVSVLFNDPARYVATGGAESLDDLFARTGEFLEEQVEPLLRQKKDVLIVGHGAMNTSIICRIRNIPLDKFWTVGIPQCELIKV